MVDLQKVVDQWSIYKGSSVMLPWLGSVTCGEAATAIANALHQIAELRAERDVAVAAMVSNNTRAEAAEADKARLSEALVKPIDMQDVRLMVGEGKLSNADVLAGVNATLRLRAALADGGRDDA